MGEANIYLLWGNQHRGERFGRLVVLGPGPRNDKHTKVRVQCECGKTKTVRSDHLRAGRTVSCGCYHLERITKHGKTGTRIYQEWTGIIQRTQNPNATGFEHYGGRGIDIDPRWLVSFSTFHGDVGEPPSLKHQLDRRDNDKGYWPGNVRWVTHQQNQWNRGKRVLARGATSRFPGVFFVVHASRWRARIRVDGKCRHLGYFKREEEAAAAYRVAALEQRGEFTPDGR
jgi:hypothetical protein